MADINYTSFLAALSGKAKIDHFVVYRNNKVKNMPDASKLLEIPTGLPQFASMEKILVADDKYKYTSYKNNVHHWTTEYCWSHAIPLICGKLQLDFCPSKYKKIHFAWNDCDFSYHQLDGCKFKVQELGKKEQLGDHSVLRSVNDCPFMHISLYHSLFKLSHVSGSIVNFDEKAKARVVFNCDSMAIPVIPIVACMCKEVLVLDNRTGAAQHNMERILQFNPTHYVALFTEENFLFAKKHIENLK